MRRPYPASCLLTAALVAGAVIILASANATANQTGQSADATPIMFAADTSHGNAAYSRPLEGLSKADRQQFAAGKAEFAARWVAPFVSGGHWGRGPQSNAESCVECHPGNGRGRAPDGPDEIPHSLVLRLAFEEPDATGRPTPNPAYGRQLGSHGIAGKLVEEGAFRIEYETRAVRLADASVIELRNPKVRFAALWYGPLDNRTIASPRIAQPVFGLGLLEAVSQSTLRKIAQQQQRIGFNGRPNMVLNEANGSTVPGRFGHKAAQPDLLQQTAAAFHTEMGVTSSLFPVDECWPVQKECYRVETVSGVEAQDEQIAAIADYLSMLAPPAQRNATDPAVMHGAKLFDRARCSVCHIPEIETATARQHNGMRTTRIRPYTDMLLHDMGEGLADGRREFLAGARDWRTAPLWGLGLRTGVNGNGNLLHDGRARSVSEAILWHGGEAEVSRQAFIAMITRERQALLRFLDSL